MKHYISDKLYHASAFFESLIGIFVLLLCIVCGISMLIPIEFLEQFGNIDFFLARLSDASYLIIGVEFIKMIASHRLNTILDIMALALSREMIIHETTPFENLLCVISIAIIFVVRKHWATKENEEMVEQSLSSDNYK